MKTYNRKIITVEVYTIIKTFNKLIISLIFALSFNTVGRRRSSKPRSKLTISHSFFTAQEAEQDSETSRKIWNIDEGDEDVIRKEEMLAQMVSCWFLFVYQNKIINRIVNVKFKY